MFSVQIDNEQALTSFLNSGDLEYVDVYLHEDSATFIMDTSDVFLLVKYPCSHTPNEISRAFRVSRNLLRQQKRANVFTFNVTESDGVIASFMISNELVCTAKFTYQRAYSSAYESKLQLLRVGKKPVGIRLGDLHALTKLSKALGGVVNIESGAAAALFSNGIRMYKSVKYSESLSILPKYIQILERCDSQIFAIEDFVGAQKDNFAVLISKLRVSSNSEYFMMEQMRSQYKADINLSNLVQFVSVHQMKVPNLILNLDSRSCSVVDSGIEYTIPVSITNEVRAKSDKVHEVTIPMSILKNIVPDVGAMTVTLEKKQFFMKMSVDNYVILFN